MASSRTRWRAIPASALAAPLAAALLAVPAPGQDPELEPLLLRIRETEPTAEVKASSLQFVRLPLGFTVRDPEERRWGLKVTLPLSFGIYELEAVSDVGSLSEKLEALTVAPGLELHIPVGAGWVIKPFGEIGIGADLRDDATELMFSLGLRAHGEYDLSWGHPTVGGAGRFASTRSRRTRIDDYTAFEVGADAQLPLGRGRRRALGGFYAIARFFPDLELAGAGGRSLGVDQVWEAGLSFSTEPSLKIWKLEVPWLAVGYRFGDLFEGLRVSFSFPF